MAWFQVYIEGKSLSMLFSKGDRKNFGTQMIDDVSFGSISVEEL